MGLLDKVDNLEETKPAKAIAKKAAPKKAAPKKAVAKKATPAKAVAKKAEPKKATTKPEKVAETIRPTGLPEGFELAGSMPRYIGWLINFAWNFGIIIGLLSILSTGADSETGEQYNHGNLNGNGDLYNLWNYQKSYCLLIIRHQLYCLYK